MRLLVCGGRDYAKLDQVIKALDEVCEKYKLRPSEITIIHGAAPGADRCAQRWSFLRGSNHDPYYAEWGKYGKRAGHMRNQRMIDEGKPDRALVFPGGKGTTDMATRLVQAGIPILRWDV